MASIEDLARYKAQTFYKKLLQVVNQGGSSLIQNLAPEIRNAYDNNDDLDTFYNRIKLPLLKSMADSVNGL